MSMSESGVQSRWRRGGADRRMTTHSHHSLHQDMSARQPFVPSRPASRSLNLSEETRNEVFAHAVLSNNNNTTSTEKKNLNHPDLEVKWTSLFPKFATNAEIINFNRSHRDPPLAPSTSLVSRNLSRARRASTLAQATRQTLDLTLAPPIHRTRTKIKI